MFRSNRQAGIPLVATGQQFRRLPRALRLDDLLVEPDGPAPGPSEAVPAAEGALADGDEYLTVVQLARYSKIGRRQLTRFLSRPTDPLPHVRNGRRLLVLRSTFDRWIAEESRRQSSTASPVARARSFREITQEVKRRNV